MKKILIVGGAGFIGSYVAKNLIGRDITPVIFDSFFQYLPHDLCKSTEKTLENRFKGVHDKLIIIRGNAANYSEVRRALEQHKPEAVAHLGGLPLANLSNHYIDETITSVQSTSTIIQVINDLKLPARFLYVSSSTVYGDFGYTPADEKHPRNPSGVYAGVKSACEDITSAFSRHFDIPFVIIRPQAVYGPTDTNKRVVSKFIESARKMEEIVIHDTNTCVDFTYVTDTAEGITLALLSENAKNQVFNISFGQGRTLAELVTILKMYYPDIKTKLSERDKSLPMRGSLDISKARNLLGFSPRYSLEDGVREYISYLQMNDKNG